MLRIRNSASAPSARSRAQLNNTTTPPALHHIPSSSLQSVGFSLASWPLTLSCHVGPDPIIHTTCQPVHHTTKSGVLWLAPCKVQWRRPDHLSTATRLSSIKSSLNYVPKLLCSQHHRVSWSQLQSGRLDLNSVGHLDKSSLFQYHNFTMINGCTTMFCGQHGEVFTI